MKPLFLMRMKAGLCLRAPGFHPEIFSRSGPGRAPARKTVPNLPCAREQEYFGDG
jgi:hypothetical protein